MTHETIIYAFDYEGQPARLAEQIAIATKAKLQSKHEESVELIYLDSFDWLFYNAGVQLLAKRPSGVKDKNIVLRWLSKENSLGRPAALPLDRLPTIAADIPAGQMHDCINQQLGIRALMPVAYVHSRQIKLAILDKEGKTCCRLIIEHNRARPSGRRKSIDLGCRLRLEALTGYEKIFNKTSKLLNKAKGLRRAEDDLFENAVKICGRRPGDYSSKVQISLNREWRADRACRKILISQLDQLERNIDGAIADTDTEFLHDLRVAIRRSRALLSRMKGAFPKTVHARFSKELAWMGANTTALRDLDVFMIDFPKYRESLRSELRLHLTPFYDFLCAHHELEQAALINYFNTKRFESGRIKWRDYLESPLPKTSSARLSNEPIGEVADRRIWKTYRRLLKEASSITSNSPADDLHELRITCKKLRYLVEFFASLYPQKQIKEIINSLKNFQENLGAFQDLDVQATRLKGFGREMIEEGETHKKTLMAIEVLIANMNNKKKQVRAEFDQRFTNFSSNKVENEFRTLCGRDKTSKRKNKNLKRNKIVESS